MRNITPEGKLLNLIKQAQHKPRLKKDLKIFTKLTIALSGVIVVIVILLIVDMTRFEYELPSVDINFDENYETIDILKPSDVDFKIDVEKTNVKNISDIKNNIQSSIKLVGIITGEESQAIVEDLQTKETLFLGVGDSIKDCKVSNIFKDSVVLDYNGEKITIAIQ
ncbi:MAG: hypothetical protein ABIG92_04575 [Candidatus Omnitrophota bacterium]